ncbi:MAG TPA: hypothetical protein VLR88_07390 [Propionibacteriaceae bacterium]|nr:hypothetical protein [Propionibacteriaceae bacterium]
MVAVLAGIIVFALLDAQTYWLRAAAGAVTMWVVGLQAGLSALALRDRSRFPRAQIRTTASTVARIDKEVRALTNVAAAPASPASAAGGRPRRSQPLRPAGSAAPDAPGRPGVGRVGTPGVVGESDGAPLRALTGDVADAARRCPAIIGERRAFPGVPEAHDARQLRPGMGSDVLQTWNTSVLLVDRHAFLVGPWAGTETASGTLLLLDWLDLVGWCREYGVPVYLLDAPIVSDVNTAALMGGADLVFPIRDEKRLSTEGWGAPQTDLFQRLQELGHARWSEQ